ncbi:hypothetical protein G6F65_018857 [Rhizopus arrhizus]|nr:hypothetical protein G6F65_018857 [Rhizopus arrhizus]
MPAAQGQTVAGLPLGHYGLAVVDVQFPLLQQVVDDGLIVHLAIVRQVHVLQHDLLVGTLGDLALGVDVDDRVVAFLVDVQVLRQRAVLFADQQILQIQDVATVGNGVVGEVLDRVDGGGADRTLVIQLPLERVAAGAAIQRVVALATDQRIVARTAVQHVVTGSTVQGVIAGTAIQDVVAVIAVQGVVSALAVDDGIAR